MLCACLPILPSFLQPLDVSCFGPVKHEFRIFLADIQFKLGTEGVTKWELPCVFEMAMEQGCSSANIIAGFKKCGICGTSTEAWMEKNQHIFLISAALNDSRIEKHITHTKAAQIGDKAVEQIDHTLQLDGVQSPLRKALNELRDMVKPCVLVAQKLGPTLCSPPRESKKRRSGPAVNTLDELQAAAKWVTDEQRREKLDEKVRGLAARHEDNEREQLEKARHKQTAKQAKDVKDRDHEAVRKLLVQHEALQPDASMDKNTLVQFYLNNKEDIDGIIGYSIPAAKRTKANLVQVIIDHHDAILEI